MKIKNKRNIQNVPFYFTFVFNIYVLDEKEFL